MILAGFVVFVYAVLRLCGMSNADAALTLILFVLVLLLECFRPKRNSAPSARRTAAPLAFVTREDRRS